MRTFLALVLMLPLLVTNILHAQAFSDITYDIGTSLEIQTGADVCADNIYMNGTFSGGGTMCDGPLPVTLSSFNASVLENNVSLSWRTGSEFNNTGFRIERMNIKENLWKEVAFVNGSGTTNEPKNYIYEDMKLQSAVYRYRLKQIDYNGNFEYFNLNGDVIIRRPGSFSISQNYPNPSNPNTKIDYMLPYNAKVTIKVYDLSGREVSVLLEAQKEAGFYTADFNGTNYASGIYLYIIKAVPDGSRGQGFSKTMKMVLIK